jgi:hypothetical protein
MARPKKDVSAYFGQKIQGTQLKVIKEAGRDSQGRILVKVLCDCGERKVAILSQVLSGHTMSHGCVKHQRYVEHTQRAVDRLTPTQIRECFLATADDNAPKPDLPSDVITAGYYRHVESLKSLPESVMVIVRKGVMAHDTYESIARDTALHAAEVGWLAKNIIRPEAKHRQEMKDHALSNIRYTKQAREYEREHRPEDEEWRRKRELQEERFSAGALHDPGSKASKKARLDVDSLAFSWHWMKTEAQSMKLDSDEQDLLKWFRETAERTFKGRRDQRRKMAQRELEKRLNDIEAAA